jgi:anaerobic selenocysteine-containing dehydrogenase
VISSFQSSRTALLCQQKITTVGNSKSDLEIIFLLAEKLGLSEKFWKTPEEMYDYLLKPAGLTFKELKKQRRLEKPLEFEGYKKAGFATPSGKIELKSSLLEKYGSEPIPTYVPVQKTDKAYPFIMTTGARVPFFRHTENRSNPLLLSLWKHPTIFINTMDAEKLKIKEGQKVRISTEAGESIQYAKLRIGMPEGVVQVIPGWKNEGNINLTVPWKNFAQGIGSVPMRNIPCKLEPIQESTDE